MEIINESKFVLIPFSVRINWIPKLKRKEWKERNWLDGIIVNFRFWRWCLCEVRDLLKYAFRNKNLWEVLQERKESVFIRKKKLFYFNFYINFSIIFDYQRSKFLLLLKMPKFSILFFILVKVYLMFSEYFPQVA